MTSERVSYFSGFHSPILGASVLGVSAFSLLVFFLLIILFTLYPEIDLWVSGLASDPQTLFYLNHPPAIKMIYHSVEILTIGLSVGLVILLIIACLRKRTLFGISRKGLLFLILALLLGPGLMVNLISKNIWGRARPAHIEKFGGKLKFTPAFVFSDQCDHNCSFVSGHSALGFYFISFALLIRRHRKKVFALALAYGALIGFARIYQGGHYLSDVIFSFFFVYFPIRMLYFWMFEFRQNRG